VRPLVLRLLRSRLLHFAVAGGVLFAVAPPGERESRVSLAGGYLASLHAAQAHRLGVPTLTGERASEVDRRAIEDEVLYREAIRLGLDRDDGVVREHLIQKMLLLAEDLGGASREPTRDEVRAYFDKTRDQWRDDERVHLVHVFATKREIAAGLEDAVRTFDSRHVEGAPPVGEAFARARDIRGSRQDFAATYGDAFADAAFAMPVGAWSAPVESRFGWHLVKVVSHEPGEVASFDDVYDRVRLECAIERRHDAIARFLGQAFRRYQVDVDGTPVDRYEPTRRLALRSALSEED
jgi:hypothetical protein